MGILYIVATPIGNLKDITLRAVEILKSVDYVLCEDTRISGKLLNHYQIAKKMVSFNDFNESSMVHSFRHSRESGNPKNLGKGSGFSIPSVPLRVNESRMTGGKVIADLENGYKVALVSDAGTPLISDPGFKLVREAIQRGVRVESIPGPSAVISALTVSGKPPDKFLFLGYLPKKSGKRKNFLKDLFTILQSMEDKQLNPSVIFFESPHRLLKTLVDIKEIYGEIDVVVCRELTKLHEELRREKISAAIEHFTKVAPKGEFTLLF